jgi:hypothetical protein
MAEQAMAKEREAVMRQVFSLKFSKLLSCEILASGFGQVQKKMEEEKEKAAAQKRPATEADSADKKKRRWDDSGAGGGEDGYVWHLNDVTHSD